MLVPIFALLVLFSVAWLFVALRNRQETELVMLNLCWWMGALLSGYMTWLTWKHRAYSENRAAIGFMLFSVPYILVTGVMLLAQVVSIRKWQGDGAKRIRWMSFGLLAFLVLQMTVGLLSARLQGSAHIASPSEGGWDPLNYSVSNRLA